MRSPLVALLIAVSFIFSLSMNSQTFKEPDFAYPQTVETQARAILASADRKSGTQAAVTRLRGTLELCAAQKAIDRKAAFAQPEFIAGQAAKLTGAPRALMLTLEASALTDIYTSDKWKYDRVDAPAEPLPADVALWSGSQFRTQIDSLLRSAADLAIRSNPIPLKTFDACISQDARTRQYFPTVADFVLWQAYSLSLRCGNDSAEAFFRAEALKLNAAGTDPWFYWTATGASDEDLWKTYCEYSSTEGARYLLAQIRSSYTRDYIHEITNKDEYIDSLRSSLRIFPNWYNNGIIENELATLTAPSISYQFPSMAAPGQSVEVKVWYEYAKKIEAMLFAVPEEKKDLNTAQIMQIGACSVDSCITDTVKGKVIFKLRIPSPGTYALLMRVDGRIDDSSRRNCITATPIVGLSVSTPGDAAAIAVDFTTGRPMPNVLVKRISSEYHTVGEIIGRTGKNGVYRVGNADNTGKIGFAYEGHDYIFGGRLYAGLLSLSSNPEQTIANIFTDRAIYHPGDTVSWAIVVARRDAGNDSEPQILADKSVNVAFFDANHQKVDEKTVVTDKFGRASGYFVAKEKELTGAYRISVTVESNNIGTRNIVVSDFKLPVFEASITSIEQNTPKEGCVRISGNATTYTGMPVIGATVKMAITGNQRIWRWYKSSQKLAELQTVTDASGNFAVDVRLDSIQAQRKTNFTDFLVEIIVSSVNAEIATAWREFTIGKPYVLGLKQANITVDTSRPVDIFVTATDTDGKNGTLKIRWQLGKCVDEDNEKIGDIVAEGSGLTGENMPLSLRHIEAGEYTMRIMPEDSALADTIIVGKIVLYNIVDNKVPSLGAPIFVPENVFTTKGKSVKIPVGVADEKIYLYVIETCDGKLVRLDSKTMSHGFHNIEVSTAGLGKDKNEVRLITVVAGRVYENNITIKTPQGPEIKLAAESFRDHLVPGMRETWRFRFMKGDQAMTDAALMATMYNKALETLVTYGKSTVKFNFFKYMPSAHISYLPINTFYDYFNMPVTMAERIYITPPDFLFDNPYLYLIETTYSSGYGNNAIAYGKATRSMVKGREALVVNDDMAEVEEESADAGAAEGESEDKFDYRVAEQLQIFWKPALVADAEGNIDLVFDMPNAIGSWMFRAMAWTPELEAASYVAECMSNKPVMVQPSLPRFLRQGDKAVLPATVYNNSGEAAEVETTVELFDLATGKITSTVKSTDKIAAGSSAVVKIDIEVAADAQSVGYRVRSRSGHFSDGEQTAIPVLASSANVIESTEFYLNPGDKTFSLNISAKEASDATLTLQYCQNPVWTIVKAMRGLMDGGKTSTSNVGALFSALAGRYITTTNPAIADALKEWKANPSEEALVSMLEKNENLKQLMLNQTPWVSTANSQTARMQALSELLDPAATSASIDKCVAALAKLQQPDGGFAWGGWSNRSSVWCTETVLTTMGLANSLGMLPTDNTTLAGMLDKAYSYLQKEATRPNAPKTDIALALIAALYPGKSLTPGAREVVRATVADIAKNWRKHSTVDKAYDIIILSANARQSLCREIFESIRQFGVEQPGRGMCFPNVDDIRGYATIIQAYKTMKASDAEIDAMRQWILVRAQATDDLGAYNPDYIIAAVLLTGSNWTSVLVEPAVKVNGKSLEVTKIERNTGYFTQTLTAKGNKGIKLEIGTNGVTPSYGSVVSIRRMPMSEIAARPGADISIEKRVLVSRDGQWVETNDFALGERVRVQLTIQTKRDLEYLTINDERPAAFQPVDQLPGFVWAAGTAFYRENLDATTNLFIGYLSAGSYYLTYDMTAATAGSFISGIATVQSQYAPEITAHSGAAAITVK